MPIRASAETTVVGVGIGLLLPPMAASGMVPCIQGEDDLKSLTWRGPPDIRYRARSFMLPFDAEATAEAIAGFVG